MHTLLKLMVLPVWVALATSNTLAQDALNQTTLHGTPTATPDRPLAYVEAPNGMDEPTVPQPISLSNKETAFLPLPAQAPINTPGSLLSVSLGVLLESSIPKYTLPGISVLYTKFIHPHWGVAGDGSFFTGKNKGINYTRTNIMGGFTYYLDILQEKDIMLIPYMMAGIHTIGTRSGLPEGPKNTQVAAGMALGTLATYALNNGKLLTFRADYNPSFAQGFTSKTLRIGVGLAFPFD